MCGLHLYFTLTYNTDLSTFLLGNIKQSSGLFCKCNDPAIIGLIILHIFGKANDFFYFEIIRFTEHPTNI